MKVIIASDIHGNIKYTKKLEELILTKNPDKIILLGDLFYSNLPSSNIEYNSQDTLNILNKYASLITCVKGNCDNEVDDKNTIFSLNKYVDRITIDNISFFITHGHLLEQYKFLFNNSYVLYGHTHIYNLEGKYLNPGSVGHPKLHPEHTCFYYENHTFYLINLDDFTIIMEKKI